MGLSFSANAPLSALRPKNMVQLYSNQTVYLLRKGNVLHLLWGVNDWAEAEYRFGETVAYFAPNNPAGARWLNGDNQFISQKELAFLIGDGEVCMLGIPCPKHRG